MRFFILLTAFVVIMASSGKVHAQSFPNPATLSTGQGAPGSYDPVWTVSQWYSTNPPNPMGLTYTPALINNNCAPGSWVDPSTLPPPVNNGNWITGTNTPCAGNTNDGYLYFRLTLNLPADCNGNSVATTGSYVLYLLGYVDNTISDVFVNGNSTGINGGGFTSGSYLNFTLSGPWVAGINYVDILVYNFPNGGNANPYGLFLVANSTASSVADGDGDGVVDLSDQCPCTPGAAPSGCPPVSISGNTTLCQGGTTTLTATGGGTYLWSDASTSAAITVTPGVGTTPYSVTVTQSSGFTSSATVNVVVNPLPNPGINPAAVAICNGGSATLTATGGTSYLWSNAATTSPITVSPATSTTYSVTVTDANTCTAATSRLVTVNQLPIPVINPAAAAICNGGSTTLTASGGTSYLWSTAATTAPITVSPTTTTTYSVTVTDANTCSATTSRAVTVNQLPIPAINPTAITICNGASTTLTASGGTSYLWSNAANTAPITVSPANTTTYRVTVTDANTCSATTSATVSVNPLPTPLINPAAATICNGGSTTLTASGATSYLWSNAATTAPITVSPTTSTTYSVTVTDANTCTAATSRLVTVNQLPTPLINPASVAICNGGSTTLTASGGTSYLWSTAATTAPITVSPTTTTTYSVTVTDANTCSASTSRAVTVNQLPIPVINPAGVTICNGDNTTLTASGGTSYLWSNAATTAPITVSPANTTSYRVTVTDANTCSASTSATVTVNQLPNPAISPASVTICNGDNTTLTASGGTSYLWSNAATTAPIAISPNTTTPYSVTVTDANNCSATASATVTVNQLPNPVINPATLTICNGDNTTLTASGGTGYLWSNAATTAPTIVSPNITSTYSVTVTDANNCSATTSATVTVNQLPNPVINPAAITICNGDNTTLTASGGTSYIWSTAATTAPITISPNNTTPYSVTVTDANNCSATTSATVTVNQLPIPAISPAAVTICNGDNTTLTASGGTSYLWSNAATTAPINVSPNTTTLYSVTVTDANNCSATTSATVTVNQLPNPAINPSAATICNGDNTTLTASGGTGYLWSNAANSAAITVSPNTTTPYHVTVTDANNCSATTSATVTVNPLPIPVINPSTVSICIGTSATLTAGGGTSYLWSNAATTAPITISPNTTTPYSVTVTDANNCSATASGTVSVNQLPVPAINPTAVSICIGASTTLTASGGTSYLWSNASNAAAITVSPNTTTPYDVTVTDANNCSATTSSTVTVNLLPVPVINPASVQICNGVSTTLTAGGGTSYLWSNAANAAPITITPNTTATYSVTVTDANTCSATTSATVTVIPTMILSTTKTDVNCNGGNNGAIDLIVSSGQSPYGYLWNTTGTTEDPSGLTAGNYSVTVTDNAGCTATTAASIIQPQALVLSSSFINPTCASLSNDGSITLNVTGGSLPYQFVWSDGSGSQNLSNIGPGDYTVMLSDAHNCIVADTFSLAYLYDLTIHATPAVTINLGESTTLSYSLNGNAGNYTSIWSPSYALSCSDCAGPVATPNVTTLYQIAVKNDAGCTATDTVSVFVIADYSIYVPNAFTPNGDGTNDMFQIFGNIKALKFLEVEIFNRWGEQVFRSNDLNFQWDGTFKGVLQQPGIFVWQLKLAFIDGHSDQLQRGSLTMIR